MAANCARSNNQYCGILYLINSYKLSKSLHNGMHTGLYTRAFTKYGALRIIAMLQNKATGEHQINIWSMSCFLGRWSAMFFI